MKEPLVTWRRTGRFGHAEVFAAVFAVSFVVARFVPVLSLGYVCPLKGMAGVPCATCGMTRAFVALAHGDVAAAVAASPLGAALAAAAWTYAAADLLRAAMGWPFPQPALRVWRAATAAGILALLVNWGWLVLREAGT